MRFISLVGVVAIAIAVAVSTLASTGAGPMPLVRADGPVVLVDSYLMSPASLVASGGELLADYGNGYYLLRAPMASVQALRELPGVDMMEGHSEIDLYYSGIRFDTAIAEPFFDDGLDAATPGAYLIQFIGPIVREWIEDLEGEGLTFDQYLANYAFVVRGSSAGMEAARGSPFVAWVGPYRAGYKIAADILDREGPIDLFVVGFAGVDPLALVEQVVSTGSAVEGSWDLPPTVLASAAAHVIPDLARLRDVLSIEERFPFLTMDRIAGQIHGYHTAWDTTRSGLTSSLTGRSPGPDKAPRTPDDYYEGAGIIDTGFDEGDANDGTIDFFGDESTGLNDRVTRFVRHTGPLADGNCGSAHGTHVAGIIAGNGYSWERYLIENVGDTSVSVTDDEWHKSEAGVAPEGKMSIDGAANGLPLCQPGLNINLQDWDCQYLNGYISAPVTGIPQSRCQAPWIDGANVVTHNAAIDSGSRAWFAIQSNSWGSGPGSYGSTATAGAADTRMNVWPERIIVFAAGNDGPDAGSVSREALLKNGISVAAGQNYRPEQFESDNPNLLASFSARGGLGQSSGRIKPDIVGIGTSVVSLFARGETLSNGFTAGADLINEVDKYCSVPKNYCAGGDGIADYRYLQGTSMAAPHVAGGALLVREYLREVAADNDAMSPYFNPPSHLVRAILINGAVRMDRNLYQYPGYDQGWGRMDLQESLFPPVPRTNQFGTGEFTTTGTWSPAGMNLNVVGDEVPVKVTLVWIDATGDALSRNLDLRVRSPSGLEYHGNRYQNGWSIPGEVAYDSINNVEQVEVERPEAGTWTVEVRGVSVPTAAKFALVFSANVGPQSTYKVDLSTSYPTAVSLAPGGSATIPFTVLNYGTSPDEALLSVLGAPAELVPTFWPSGAPALASGESQDGYLEISATTATPGIYEFDLVATSRNDTRNPPSSDFIRIRAEVLASPVPFPMPVTTGSVDELDPSVLVFEDPPGSRHIFIAYRKTSQVSADGLTGGVNVWVAHATLDVNGIPGAFTHAVVSNVNDDPNDLRLLRLQTGTFVNRVVLTWTGNDPDEANADATSWSRIARLDAPYGGSWAISTIQKNEGTDAARTCRIARVSFPLFRAAGGGNGQIIYVWETLLYPAGCTGTDIRVHTYAKTSTDGGSSWSALTQVFPPTGNNNLYFFPNGAVDQNDVAWVFAYWRTPTGNDRDLTVRLFDNSGWGTFPRNDYTILDTTDNVQWPAALSTSEGAAGNRVYVTFTRDALLSDLKLYLMYTDGTYSSGSMPVDYRDPVRPGVSCGPGCTLSADFAPPVGSGLKGPYGASVSNANYDRRPILNVVRTGDGIVWLPHMENANAYGSPNLYTYYSGDGFGTAPAQTILTADAFAKGHQMSDTLSVGGRDLVYEVYHSSRGTVTQVNYEVYLLIYFSGWPSAPDTLGSITTSVGGTPNPVPKENSFRVTANGNDITTGNSRITGMEYSIDSSGGPWNPMAALDGFDSPSEAGFVDLDVPTLGWGDLECHAIYVRASDELGNVGPASSYEQCTTGVVDPPPFAPVVAAAGLGGVAFRDVTVSWNAATDEGQPSGTTRYRVYRQVGVGGTPGLVTEILATGASTYSWTDVGAGDGDGSTYIYEVRSVDAADNEATAITRAAKFTRSVTTGWHLFSVPVVMSDTSVTTVLQTLSWNRARTFVASDTADPWKAYITTKAYNDLATIDDTQAIWVNVLAADSFTVAGLVPSGVTLTLQPGWNFVGFPSFRATTYTLGEWQTAVPQITMVDTYDTVGPYYLRRMTDAGEALQLGHGYWAFVDGAAPVTWAVP